MIRWTNLKHLTLASSEEQNNVWVGIVASDIDWNDYSWTWG
jgi:hypothetical protein